MRARTTGLEKLTDSARRGELVAVVGSGVSIALTKNEIPELSWKGLVEHGFSYGVKIGKITAKQAKTWKAQLGSTDLDELLAAAEFVGGKLGAPNGDLYAAWLKEVFEHVQPANKAMERALRALRVARIPLCTLNYDPLLERVTGLSPVNLTETAKVLEWMRRNSAGVLHLHGFWEAPATCILGIRDYQTALGDKMRGFVQQNLGSLQRLLFIGCGGTFADPNFSALIRWLRENMGSAAHKHYALVPDDAVAGRHADPAWHGFAEPIGYGASHGALPGFLLRHFPASTPAAVSRKVSPALGHAKLLQDYRSFLLKDCGQMTIEGVRADMDTAQRRFDLERLFVPLRVSPTPPEIPEADPLREQKRLEWQEKNKEPLPFGKVFAKHQRLALLALPGGGKTLLLKRLAVAYAEPSRRAASADALPELDLTPVLIRCRDWREHIHRPILTLLRNLPEITGQPQLAGLVDALIPLFRKGRVLFLVDGLDEIHDDGLRTTFVDNLDAFLANHKHVRVVVTSREAGFSLVAPSLARFCERWRVAPLDPDAIAALCDHWHRLMTGDSPEALAESKQVAEHLLESESLRRLAENPLLLTMLLVVKHGAGRLPPDRVSLYSRAVEVLLDTWNIKGHDPLNVKEAVPQLAFVALELMRAGKQTATEKELLTILEKARDHVPQIRRYAKDTPQEFLKRVELRSSLLVEAGRQAEGRGTAPFYQFRHLTFQEYLAAVAAFEGHYVGYETSNTVLTPLQDCLTAEEWKEVIPMSAVLAGKQAEPLVSAMVKEGNLLRRQVDANEDFAGKTEWLGFPTKLPAAIARLVQCLAEETEAAPETLTAALRLIAFFARGCRSQEDWRALSRGPYGEDLLHQAWLLYAMNWPRGADVRGTYATLAAIRWPDTYWDSGEGEAELPRLLKSENEEDIGRGLLTCSGLLWRWAGKSGRQMALQLPLGDVERHLLGVNPALREAALWAWALIHDRRQVRVQPSHLVLNCLLSMWLNKAAKDEDALTDFALSTQLGLARHAWRPVLTEAQLEQVRQAGQPGFGEEAVAACVVAFHNGNVWSDEELATRLVQLQNGGYSRRPESAVFMLEQMGEVGQKYLSLLD